MNLRSRASFRPLLATMFLGGSVFLADCGGGLPAPPPEPVHLRFEDAFRFVGDLTIEGSAEAPLLTPFDVHWAEDKIYITDPFQNLLLAFGRDGQFLDRIGGTGEGPGEFRQPLNVVSDQKGNLYVSDPRHRKVLVFDAFHEFVRDFAVDGQMQQFLLARDDAEGVRLATVGLVGETLIQTYDADGSRGPEFPPMGTDWPFRGWAATVGPAGEIYLINEMQDSLFKFSGEGALLETFTLASPTQVRFRGNDLDVPRTRTRNDVLEAFGRLQTERHTRINELVVSSDFLLVGLKRYQFDEGASENVVDVYDHSGNLLYYGIDTPGRLESFGGSIYFVTIDDEGDNYGSVTLHEYGLALSRADTARRIP